MRDADEYEIASSIKAIQAFVIGLDFHVRASIGLLPSLDCCTGRLVAVESKSRSR